ncbi:MAG: TolC family protein [Acidobacteriota bacterium]
MKRLAVVVTMLAAAVAQAQPAPAPTPQPTPPPDQPPPQPPQGETPSWLPGVQDVTASEIATPGKLTITMPRAVEIALRQHPTLRVARAQADAAAGHIEQARVPLHPTLTLAGSANAGSRQTSFNSNGGFLTVQEGFNAGANASWRITDFGQTAANVRAAEANAEAQNASVASDALDVRQSVELAYLEAVARNRLVIVAQATVKSEEGHLDQAKRFVAAQAHDPIEVAQAQAREANAKSALAQAQSNEAVALSNLRAAIGWVDPTRQPAVDPNWPIPSDQEPPALAALVDTARQRRPDIVQLDKLIVAAQFTEDAAHAERRPVLSASAQAQYNPSSFNWSPEPTWAAGLTLSWLAWDGGKSRADVHVAHANYVASVAQRDELLVTLTSQLESSRAQIVAARANLQASNEAVQAAQAQLKLAEARYTQGLGSQIELADAQTAVTTAQGNLVSAQWQLADAWASLQRQLGGV